VRRVRATTAARPDLKVIAYVPVALADDSAQARDWLRPLLARYLGALHGQSILADAGFDAPTTQPFRDALAAGRLATDLVTDDHVNTLAIAGRPAECRKALVQWADAGLDGIIAVVPDRPDFVNQLERIGRELSPAWRELRHR
jgi:5,10-methylenetetrahydromethanopterin reductase